LILLTRLDKSKVLINVEAIKFAEATPDTLITFLNGDSILVRESLEELEQRVINYKSKILSSDHSNPRSVAPPPRP
jgi:flagellar protein FlbD